MQTVHDDGSIVVADLGGPDLASNQSVDVAAVASAADPASPDSGRRADTRSIAARISHFLAGHRPALFCDDCISDQLGLSHRRQANRATTAMANTSTFWRAVGACSACNRHKQVIRHV